MKEKNAGNILIVDDESDVLLAAKLLLKPHFSHIHCEENPANIGTLLEQKTWDLILLDMNFEIGANSGDEGLKYLQEIRRIDSSAIVILMTAYGGVEMAVRAMREGAADFVLKPWQNERLLTTVVNALKLRNSTAEVRRLKSREKELSSMTPGAQVIGSSEAMRNLIAMVQRTAPTEANVLLLGENGTGKEVIATEIWNLSARNGDIFMRVDLGAISENLFESELFGHLKGAFTGADSNRIGRFQAADGGTLFLDEISNLPLHLQRKLLSVLEQREITPLGSNKAIPVDLRLICASNRSLKKMVNEGTFREDLLYRINTVEIELPPLRQRPEDIPLLLEHFIGVYGRKYNLTEKRLSTDALSRLQSYHWPGNVRELRHAVERALIMSASGVLRASDFLFPDKPQIISTSKLVIDNLNLDHIEKAAIERALLDHTGNISHAAKTLGITRTALYRRMDKYEL